MGTGSAQIDLKLYRGEARDYVFIYRPRDRTLPPYDLTGKSVVMRIRPQGQSEIVYMDANPGCYLSDAANGEITINPSIAQKDGFDFQNAPFVVYLAGKRLFSGTVMVKHQYER